LKALIHAAGSGKRLAPLTDYLPKPLIPVAGRPMIEYVIDLFDASLVDELLIDYQNPLLPCYFEVVHHALPTTMIAVEGRGTALDLLQIHEKVGQDRFFVANCDIFAQGVDVRRMLEVGGDSNVLGIVEVDDRAEFGSVRIGKHGRVLEYKEKTGMHERGLAYLGLCLLRPSVLRLVRSRTMKSLEKDLLPYLARKGDLYGFVFEGASWIDLGTPERIAAAERSVSVDDLSPPDRGQARGPGSEEGRCGGLREEPSAR